MKKGIVIACIIVGIFIIGDLVVFNMFGKDPEVVEYESNFNVTDKDDNNINENVPVVYMTTDISSESLVKIYEALNWKPTGKVAVKLSTGEPPASNYLDPDLIKDL